MKETGAARIIAAKEKRKDRKNLSFLAVL